LCENLLPSKDGEALSEMAQCVIAPQFYAASGGIAAIEPHWFAAFTTPRHEKHVAELLTEREIESFLPLYKACRQWKKSAPVELQLPLFPNYVFVRIGKQSRGTVLSLPGVVSIVGSSRGPWPLPESEIEILRSGIRVGRIEPHPYLTVGTRVRVKAGVMAGVEGILTRVKNGLRVVMSLDAIMKSVAVEVDMCDIEMVC